MCIGIEQHKSIISLLAVVGVALVCRAAADTPAQKGSLTSGGEFPPLHIFYYDHNQKNKYSLKELQKVQGLDQ